MQAASRPFGTAYELFGAIRFFIKYTFILYLFGATNFYNFSIILIKYKNNLTQKIRMTYNFK